MKVNLKILKNNKKKKRIGRGFSSGKGKTCGRGTKGQKARYSKNSPYVGFEGGQTPIYRVIPKRGFSNSPFKKKVATLNLDQLDSFNEGQQVDLKTLKESKLIGKNIKYVKILSRGDLNKALHLNVYKISKCALEKLEKQNGSCKIYIAPRMKKFKKKVISNLK